MAASSDGTVFISHVEEDARVALEIADALQEAGYSTWCYEVDSIPGPSYLLQTSQAIERSSAVIVLISPHSLGSHQVTKEVVRAHESDKAFIPVLISISHVEFANRQPEWREAIGSATTIALPAGGVGAILPRILNGLSALGIEPTGDGSEPGARRAAAMFPLPTPPPRPLASRFGTRNLVVGAVAVALVVGVAAIALGGGGEDAAVETSTVPSVADTTATTATTSLAPEDLQDSATTPIETSQGAASISNAQLVTEACPPAGIPGECQTAAGGTRFLILDLRATSGGDLTYNQTLSQEGFASYVAYEGQRATASSTWLLEDSPRGFRVLYAVLPPEAVGNDVNLFWPENPPLRVHPTT